jgi:hypothetical protein
MFMKVYRVWFLSFLGFSSFKVHAMNKKDARSIVKIGLKNMGERAWVLNCKEEKPTL